MSTHRRLPIASRGHPWPIRRKIASLKIYLQERAAGVVRMKLHGLILGFVLLEHSANAEFLNPLLARRMVVTLRNHHVAAITCAPFQVASARSTLPDG